MLKCYTATPLHLVFMIIGVESGKSELNIPDPIFILNRTVKPVLTWLTIPLTAMTLGLFYPLINAFILKLTDWILGKQFQINGILWLIVVSIVISIMKAIMDNFIIDGIIKGGKRK